MEETAECHQLTTSALIAAYHNEPVLWDTHRNASETDKELAWARLAMLFNTRPGFNCVNL